MSTNTMKRMRMKMIPGTQKRSQNQQKLLNKKSLKNPRATPSIRMWNQPLRIWTISVSIWTQTVQLSSTTKLSNLKLIQKQKIFLGRKKQTKILITVFLLITILAMILTTMIMRTISRTTSKKAVRKRRERTTRMIFSTIQDRKTRTREQAHKLIRKKMRNPM